MKGLRLLSFLIASWSFEEHNICSVEETRWVQYMDWKPSSPRYTNKSKLPCWDGAWVAGFSCINLNHGIALLCNAVKFPKNYHLSTDTDHIDEKWMSQYCKSWKTVNDSYFVTELDGIPRCKSFNLCEPSRSSHFLLRPRCSIEIEVSHHETR